MDIPLYIVSGFLGSGKTTLMRRLLQYVVSQGRRPGTIVNDFGAVNVDAAELQRLGLPLAELTGGCVCCTNASQLPPAVKRLIRNGSDIILVETSGLANPIELLDQVTMPWLVPNVHLAGVIVIVDAAGWANLGDQRELATDQVLCADVLIVNKCDLRDAAAVAALSTELRAINNAARQIPTSQAAVDIASLLDITTHPRQPLTHTAHDSQIRSISLSAPRTIDRDRFSRFLASLPPGVLRAKGIVQTSDIPVTSIFQYVPGQQNIYPFDTSDTELLSGVVVIIGQGLDESALQAALNECGA